MVAVAEKAVSLRLVPEKRMVSGFQLSTQIRELQARNLASILSWHSNINAQMQGSCTRVKKKDGIMGIRDRWKIKNQKKKLH